MLKTKSFSKIYTTVYILLMLVLHLPSKGQKSPDNPKNIKSDVTSSVQNESGIQDLTKNRTITIDKNIRSIYQDKKSNYWFGTNGSGVFRYDGKTLIQYTVHDGLSNNQVQSIQEDSSGNIWFGTGMFGVSRFDGKKFITYTNKENLQINKGGETDWKSTPSDLWFFAGGGVYQYNGNSIMYLPLNKPVNNSGQSQGSPFNLSRYGVYSIIKDKKGNVWFGTQAEGVCRFDGTSFTWYTEKGLRGPAVLGLFEDSKGNIWFGNNGSGLFRYDGKSLINFTEEKGLSNKEFNVSGQSGPGTLARIYTINEDKNGNLWIGTVDAGVWRYDGLYFTNYTKQDGLTSNAINIIYKDRKGELWFGTDGDGICKFNGVSFYECIIHPDL